MHLTWSKAREKSNPRFPTIHWKRTIIWSILQGFYRNTTLLPNTQCLAHHPKMVWLKKWNRTIKDMVRSMVSNFNLLLFLWSEAIKTTTYLLNRVPTKAIPKTPFELWKSWKPSVRHAHVWGCLAKVRVYNPQEKKLDSRIVSRYFIGYVKKSKEYKFYYLSYIMKIIETHNVRFWRMMWLVGEMNLLLSL